MKNYQATCTETRYILMLIIRQSFNCNHSTDVVLALLHLHCKFNTLLKYACISESVQKICLRLLSIKQARPVLFFFGFQGKTFALAMLQFPPDRSSFSKIEVIVSSLDISYELEQLEAVKVCLILQMPMEEKKRYKGKYFYCPEGLHSLIYLFLFVFQ